ncbi:MAG: DUF1579 domain-containing protein [Chitinophagaceae bacterium]
MKKKLLTLCVLLFLTAACQLQAQANQEAAMKAWMEYMTPGDIHKMLSKADGEWTYEATMWMERGAPAEKSTGTAVNKMILGGRYQESKYAGNMMGMPFEGYSLTGYDNARKVFQSSWVDNMGTGVMQLEGKLNAATKTIISTGKMTDASTGKEIKVRETFTMIDDNTQKLEMYDTREGGKEFKTMEITFKRKG